MGRLTSGETETVSLSRLAAAPEEPETAGVANVACSIAPEILARGARVGASGLALDSVINHIAVCSHVSVLFQPLSFQIGTRRQSLHPWPRVPLSSVQYAHGPSVRTISLFMRVQDSWTLLSTSHCQLAELSLNALKPGGLQTYGHRRGRTKRCWQSRCRSLPEPRP